MLQIKGFFGLEFEHRIFIAAPPERGAPSSRTSYSTCSSKCSRTWRDLSYSPKFGQALSLSSQEGAEFIDAWT